MTTARGLAFAAAKRMVDGVHRHAAHVRPLAEPAAPARLADRHFFMIDVANLANRRETLDVDLPDLTGWHLHRRVLAFLLDELNRRACTPRDLTALARLQLDVVDLGAKRNVLQ